MDDKISDESKLNVLLGIYYKDREEEREQRNRLHNLFTTFILLFLGATNAFMQLKDPTLITWLIFFISIFIASALYCYLHTGMQKSILDIAKIKEGREILIKLLLNDTEVEKYKDNLIKTKIKEKDAVDELKDRIRTPAYPFIKFDDIIHLKLNYKEDNKKYAVIATGIVVSLLTFCYWFFKGQSLYLL